MKIFFLGVGSAINSKMFKSCYLINNRILIDASPEASMILNKQGIELGSLSAVIFTHLHGDHILGLPLLLTEFLIQKYDGDKFRVCGPLGIEQTTNELLKLSYPEVKPDIFISKSKASFEILKPGSTLDFGDIKINVVPVVHGAVQAFGFFVTGKDASLFISGDTILCDEVRKNVEKADFSLIDVTTETERLPTHMNLEDVRELQESVSKEQFFFAVHRTFNISNKEKNLVFPEDFETYEIKRGCYPTLLKNK